MTIAIKIEAPSLALTGIRHAFFTRAGGVSGGVYASLNGGTGSRDEAAHVAENRARMAAMLGVEPQRFLTVYQTHSPHAVRSLSASPRLTAARCFWPIRRPASSAPRMPAGAAR